MNVVFVSIFFAMNPFHNKQLQKIFQTQIIKTMGSMALTQ